MSYYHSVTGLKRKLGVKLRDYGAEIKRSNPDSTACLDVERIVPSEPAHFSRMYMFGCNKKRVDGMLYTYNRP